MNGIEIEGLYHGQEDGDDHQQDGGGVNEHACDKDDDKDDEVENSTAGGEGQNGILDYSGKIVVGENITEQRCKGDYDHGTGGILGSVLDAVNKDLSVESPGDKAVQKCIEQAYRMVESSLSSKIEEALDKYDHFE